MKFSGKKKKIPQTFNSYLDRLRNMPAYEYGKTEQSKLSVRRALLLSKSRVYTHVWLLAAVQKRPVKYRLTGRRSRGLAVFRLFLRCLVPRAVHLCPSSGLREIIYARQRSKRRFWPPPNRFAIFHDHAVCTIGKDIRYTFKFRVWFFFFCCPKYS